jgi:transcriptional regulator with XRE-family HTH domain
VSEGRDLSRDIGAFIKDLRNKSRISLRQLAEQAGVSNPYLSQIERGLRKPSAEVLQQIAGALRVSTPLMYLRAGLLEGSHSTPVPTAIAADPVLTDAQKQSLIQIYETFRRENSRAESGAATADMASETVDSAGATAAVAGETVDRHQDQPAAVQKTRRRTTARRSAGGAASGTTKRPAKKAAPKEK